ncbi:MAG: SLC13 family permease [Cyanobacteriota bacterium]
MSIFILFCLLVLFILLYKNIARPSVLFFIFLCVFLFINQIKIEDFLSNFANPALISLILLLITASILSKTNLIQLIKQMDTTKNINIFKLAALISLISAFVSNCMVISLSIKALHNVKNAYRLLLPISFMIIIAGTCTLIGTTTNLIINSFVVGSGMKSLKMFDFIYVGIPLVIVGLLYITIFTNKILKEKKVVDDHPISNYFLEAKVLSQSPLIGHSVKDNNLRNLENLFLAEIVRDKILISPVSPEEMIYENDTLVFTGDIDNIKDLQTIKNLRIFNEKSSVLRNNLVWAVLSHNSSLIGKTIKKANFRSKFDAAVVAVKRGDEKLSGKIGLIKLQAGDYLILAVGQDFYKNDSKTIHFYLYSELELSNKLDLKKSIFVISAFVITIVLVALGLINLLKGLIVLLFIYVLTECATVEELKRAFNFEIFILVGAALGISKVLLDSGAATIVSDAIILAASQFGVFGCFVGIYIMTVLFTQVVHNNAVAALVFPVAYSTATTLGVNPLPFIMAVAYGASASFLTPYGYHVNLLVFATGNYKQSDFFKLGLPLTIVYSILVIVLVPIFFKF